MAQATHTRSKSEFTFELQLTQIFLQSPLKGHHSLGGEMQRALFCPFPCNVRWQNHLTYHAGDPVSGAGTFQSWVRIASPALKPAAGHAFRSEHSSSGPGRQELHTIYCNTNKGFQQHSLLKKCRSFPQYEGRKGPLPFVTAAFRVNSGRITFTLSKNNCKKVIQGYLI